MKNCEWDYRYPKTNGRWLSGLGRVLNKAVQNDAVLKNSAFALGEDGRIQKAIGRCRSGGGFEWKYREKFGSLAFVSG